MSWVTKISLGKKLIMALSGLFLILFLVGHLVGNIPLLYPDNGQAFNEYAHFMKHNPLIIASEVFLFIGFLVHIIDGLVLYFANIKARSQGYAVPNKNKKVNPFSKFMGPLGMILLVFLILHLKDFFWFKYIAPEGLENIKYGAGEAIPNLYALVIHEFGDEGMIHLPIYLLGMMALSFHLNHGFQSAFQSMGINHKKYTPAIKLTGTIYSILIPAAFAAIPLTIFIQSL